MVTGNVGHEAKTYFAGRNCQQRIGYLSRQSVVAAMESSLEAATWQWQ